MLTVGIPAFETWPKVARVLESLRSQHTEASYQIILVDDCHPERLAERVRGAFPEVICRRNERNRGPAYARNRILELAEGGYVAFFDADCIVPARWMDTVLPHLEERTVLSGRVVGSDGREEWGPRRATWLGVSRRCRAAQANVASSNNMVVPTRMALDIGGFNEDLGIYFEDSLFSLEFRRAGGEIRYLADAEVLHDHDSRRDPERIRRQCANTLWSMHHFYHARPWRQRACWMGLLANYLLKAGAEAARLDATAAHAYLDGIREGTDRARRATWRWRWIRDA